MHTHQVDPDGDIILFTPATSEAPSVDVIEGNVPGEHTRFQVSSKHLTLASDYFKRMLKACWAEGVALSAYGSVEIPVNDCKPEILLIILNIIHGHSRQVPRKLSLPQLTDIAVATDFFQCHEALEVFAGTWIQDLKPPILSSFSEDTKKWMMIAWVFKANDILRDTETIAMQQGTGPFQASSLPISKSIKDKIDQSRQNYIELLQEKIGERIETLLNSPAAKKKSCCAPGCDAKHLGLVLRKLNEKKISYSYKPCSPFFTVGLENVSPITICLMVAYGRSDGRAYCAPRKRCENYRYLFGDDAAREARKLPTSR
ncbi:hypothetical protein N7519_008757 [Penicillium mononematosum]|uniref:uncharacterized protein n=1 Tax=Penicillium mononematosum TaxID=268346 RepID=UPI002547B73F|nr:uncharacterized protein N7519_008757 [Penicillium mononematosum]KAJ6178296.1 hypothetical protein N7519_008757 [Penicillium mononematosum]